MLTIRLTRKGKKNQPFFRVVAIDKRRSSKGGRAVEDLGYVNPLTKKRNFNAERIKYWLSKGAVPSDTIHNYLVSEKIIDAKKVHVSKLSAKKQAEISAATKAEADKKVEPTEPAQSPADNEAGEAAAPVEVEKPAEQAVVEELKMEEPKPEA